MHLKHTPKATVQRVNSGHWTPTLREQPVPGRLKLAQIHLWSAGTGDDLTSLESSCWLMTASASSAAWRLASATVRSILARSEVIMSWAFRSASDTAFCNSAIAWRFTSFTASSAKEGRNPHQRRTFGTRLRGTGAWNAADTLLYSKSPQRNLVPQDSSSPRRCWKLSQVSNTCDDSCYFDSWSVLLYAQTFQISGVLFFVIFFKILHGKLDLQHTRFINIFQNNYYLRYNSTDFFKNVSLSSGN